MFVLKNVLLNNFFIYLKKVLNFIKSLVVSPFFQIIVQDVMIPSFKNNNSMLIKRYLNYLIKYTIFFI